MNVCIFWEIKVLHQTIGISSWNVFIKRWKCLCTYGLYIDIIKIKHLQCVQAIIELNEFFTFYHGNKEREKI